MKPSPITCLSNALPHSLYGIYRLVFTISHHLYETSHYLPQVTHWINGVPCLVSVIPHHSLYCYGLCCLLYMGLATCFLWDLLPAFCRTQSTSCGTHYYIVVETTLFCGARCLLSLGLAACFRWESLPVSHEPPPACFQARSPHYHLPGQMSGPTHPAPLAHQFPAWLLSSLQLRCSGLHPFLDSLLSSQVSRVEGRPQNPSPWWLSAGPTTCFLGLQRHHLAGECI